MSRLRVLLIPLAAFVLATATGLVPAGAAPLASSPVPVGLTDDFYFPLAHPVRVADTRVDGGPMHGGEVRTFSLAPTFDAARPGTSPRSAGVWVLNVTVTNPSSAGVLILDSGYQSTDYATLNRSNLNWRAGQTVANQVVQSVKLDETFVLWISSGTADVIVDANGFFPFDSASGTPTTRSHFLPLTTPTRVYDTRLRDGHLAPGEARVLALGLPSDAIGDEQVLAAVATVTVTNPTGAGSLTTWDGDGPPPTTSTLNYVTGQTVTNNAVIPVACLPDADNPCTDLTMGVAVSAGAAADVIIDVTGYFRLDPEMDFLGFSPSQARVGDSRTPLRNPGPLRPGTTANVDISAVPYGGTVVGTCANITVVNPSQPTSLTGFVGPTIPGTTALTAYPGGATATTGFFRTSDRRFRLWNAFGRTDVVVDVEGVLFVEREVQDAGALSRDGKRFTHADVRLVVG